MVLNVDFLLIMKFLAVHLIQNDISIGSELLLEVFKEKVSALYQSRDFAFNLMKRQITCGGDAWPSLPMPAERAWQWWARELRPRW